MSLIHHPTLGRWGKTLGATLAAAGLAACASAPVNKADSDLVDVERGNFDHVFMLPEQPLADISSVYVAEATVTMSDYWLRDHRTDYAERDLERIKREYGELVRETLVEKLQEESDVEIVESPGQADVVFRPTLRELNIYAPDLAFHGARMDQYIESAGNATFDLVVVDPQSEQVVAQFLDHRETPPIVIGDLEETNRATNYRLFRRLMERWTNNLLQYLDDQDIVG